MKLDSTMVKKSDSIHWVEKYRPSRFDDIVLDKTNQSIFCNILEKQYFPNMLFYGPPGTGKTSTILALARDLFGPKKFSDRVIELNASDERGINIVRKKIISFAKMSIGNSDDNLVS